MEIGILRSVNQSKYPNIKLTESRIVFGRSPKSDVVLSDIRCSGVHCEVIPEGSNFIVQDHSSNGTYVNGRLIGKNNRVLAHWEDQLDILPPSKSVDKNSSISYVFSQSLKRKNSESHTETAVKPSEDIMEAEITCSICFEIINNPVSLYPCLHNFCEICYLDWKSRSSECPDCRGKVNESMKNPQLQLLIDIYIEKYPDKSKTIEKCRQCEEKIDNFKCSVNQQHVKCQKCSVLMPKRKESKQNCEVCGAVYCCLYFKQCKAGLDSLRSYFDKDGFVPPGCLNNKFEETVICDYIHINRIKGIDICGIIRDEDVLRYELDSVICENCIEKVWTEIIERFRLAINSKLPISIQNRPKCGKGRACILQNTITHAQLYSHF